MLAPTPAGKTYLLYMLAPDLVAQEFDEASGQVQGEPVVLVSNIARVASPALRPAVGVSPAGVLAYQAGDPTIAGQCQWVDRAGEPVELLPERISLSQPRLSPDGSAVVGERSDTTGSDIWTVDLIRQLPVRRTFSDADDNYPIWSPDGTQVAFLRFGGDEIGTFVLDLESGLETKVSAPMRPTSWSPDGRYLLAATSGQAWLVSVDDDEESVAIGSRNGRTADAEFSPNGDYIAFVSNESGFSEVYVVPTPPAAGPQTRVSIDGGRIPRWSKDGTELFFFGPSGADVYAVDVDTNGAFTAGIPEPLFTLRSFQVASGYAVSNDGQRFLVRADGSAEGGQESAITVVLNWWAELER